jgi:ATP-dependent RNA helicase RhlE
MFDMPFLEHGLLLFVLDGVKVMGYADPRPIQLRAIPLLHAGRDVIGSAHQRCKRKPYSQSQ